MLASSTLLRISRHSGTSPGIISFSQLKVIMSSFLYLSLLHLSQIGLVAIITWSNHDSLQISHLSDILKLSISSFIFLAPSNIGLFSKRISKFSPFLIFSNTSFLFSLISSCLSFKSKVSSTSNFLFLPFPVFLSFFSTSVLFT